MRARRFGNSGSPTSRVYKVSHHLNPSPPGPAFKTSAHSGKPPLLERLFKASPRPASAPAPARPQKIQSAAPHATLGAQATFPVVNLVTAVSRPDNLPRIHRSAEFALSRSRMRARWIIVVDGHEVVPPAIETQLVGDRLQAEKIVHGGGRCPYGIAQKNQGMDAVGDGYYHCLDDDNIVHPDFFSGLQRAIEGNPARRAFVFGQQRWDSIGNLVASPHRMTLYNIDNTMFVVHSSLIGHRRYDIGKAGSEDFYFFKALYEAHREEFVFIPETLAYYNFIRHFPQETPQESTVQQVRPAVRLPDRVVALPRIPGVLRVALYSSKRDRCGISTYTSQIEDALASMGHEVRHWGSQPPHEVAFDEMRAWRPDIFHVQYEPSIMPPEGVLAGHSDLLRQDGVRVMVTLHTADAGSLRVARRVTGSVPGCIIAHLSPPGAQDVVVLPMPCTSVGALPARESARRRFGLPEGAFVISTVGFMIPWKDHPRIAECMVPWLRERPDVHVQIIASEHFNEGLRAYAETCRAQLSEISSRVQGRRIHHVDGYPSDQEVIERIAASDLGYVWCPFDTASSSAAGAQFTSARCPLVATDSSHYASLGTGVVRSKKGDVGAFVDLIRRTAEDPALLVALRANQWDMYRQRNYLEAARAHVSLYGGGR